MEAWTVVFRNLYTGFLLRDFAGKIVPGMLLLFSISSLFRSPRSIISEIKKEVPIFVVLLIAGLAWTVTLGTQSLAEGLGIWRYFPAGDAQPVGQKNVNSWETLFTPPPDVTFDKDTLVVDEFQSKASEDEKQQYERFVVIKEACGNLFVATLLSIPAGLYIRLKQSFGERIKRQHYWARCRVILAVTYLVLIMAGLHRMHLQHVYRQLRFAQDLVQKRKGAPENRPSSFHLDLEQKQP